MRSSHSLQPRSLASGPANQQPAAQENPLAIATARLGLLLALALLLWLGALQLVPPPVVPSTAPPTSFSAERAMADLRVIAAAPRPAGAQGHGAARHYLLEQLSALGLSPEIQVAPAVIRFPGSPAFSGARVQNVIARIPGTQSSGAILLNAHYDGGHTGPAAADCGACVVAVLETLRAVRAGPPLANDLIVVFSDAEENGDLGAVAFATGHPWARDVRLALNFEAQGSRGPAQLYAASPENGKLIAAYAAAAPHPQSSSFLVGLSALFAAQRPGCDLEEYIAIGSAGLGFLFAGDTPAYHTVRDSMDVIDPRAIQHMGANTLALVRYFGGLNLSVPPRGPDVIFFTILPGVLVSYPASWAVPLALLVTAAALLAVGYGLRRRRLGLGGALGSAAALLLGIPLSVALVAALWWAVRALTPNYQVLLVGTYQTRLNILALACIAIGLQAALAALLLRLIQPLSLAAGAVLAWLPLLLVVSVAAPAASYLLAWPLLFTLLPLAGAAHAPERTRRPWLAVGLLALAAMPGLVLLPSTIHGATPG
jgi:hypothetical protein